MPIETRLKQKILKNGPISVAEFMNVVLADPDHGYYMARDPFGVSGDFTTAPEINQMFGEMIGVWLADTWIKMDRPSRVSLIECGPGRGTLMGDMLRATKHVSGFHEAISVYLMEISPVLRQQQKETLKDYEVSWINDLDEVPRDKPALIIANEFLDALPIHQLRGKEERMVDWGKGEGFHFTLPAANLHETSPAREYFMKQVAALLKQTSGAGLFIDYGYTQGRGDTLQAIHKHEYCHPMENLGEADITAHVDFGALRHIMPSKITGQGAFLNALGIEYRAEALSKNAKDKDTIAKALHRLTHDDEMGALFKVLGVSHDPTLLVTGFR